MLNIGDTIANRYNLIKLLGRGGFSEVWLAQDNLTDVKVALKIYAPGMGLDDAGISLFTQEFSLVFDMNHTNLLRPTHYDSWERMPYLILPFCKNGSAFKFLGNIAEEEAWKLLHDVAAGLAYLHSKTPPVIHQDIKPDNILISDEGYYMITDFGISTRVRSTLRKNQSQENSGGTLAYMGPERFGATPAPIMASDIWSLGATVYELLTGMPPYGDHGGVLQKNGADIPLIMENYSQPLKDIIYSCLALEPWERPTANQIADYTEQYISRKQEPLNIRDSQINAQEAANTLSRSFADSVRSVAEKQLESAPQKRNKRIGIIVGASTLLVILLAIIFISGGDEEAVLTEPTQPEILPVEHYDNMCQDIINEGLIFEEIGERFRFVTDTLSASNDSVFASMIRNIPESDSLAFEDFYINALEKYRQAEYYKDSVSQGIRSKIESRIEYIGYVLDSTAIELLIKSESMKRFDMLDISETFVKRAERVKQFKENHQ